MNAFVAVLTEAYLILLAHPIRRAYLNGPSRLGCWAGRSESHICASLTGVDAVHWDSNPLECTAIVDRDVNSVVVVAETTAYFMLLYAAVRAALDRASRRDENLKVGTVLMLESK